MTAWVRQRVQFFLRDAAERVVGDAGGVAGECGGQVERTAVAVGDVLLRQTTTGRVEVVTDQADGRVVGVVELVRAGQVARAGGGDRGGLAGRVGGRARGRRDGHRFAG